MAQKWIMFRIKNPNKLLGTFVCGLGIFLGAMSLAVSQTSPSTSRFLLTDSPKKETIIYPYMPDLLNDPRLRIQPESGVKKKILFLFTPRQCSPMATNHWLLQAWANYLKKKFVLVDDKALPYIYQNRYANLSNLGDIVDLKKYLSEDSRKDDSSRKDPINAPWQKNYQSDSVAVYLVNQWPAKERYQNFCNGNAISFFSKSEIQTYLASLAKDIYATLEKNNIKTAFSFYVLAGFISSADAHELDFTVMSDPAVKKISFALALFDAMRGEIVWQKRERIKEIEQWQYLDKLSREIIRFMRGGNARIDLSRLPVGYRIYLNQRFIGYTPLHLEGMTKGVYNILLKKNDGQQWQLTKNLAHSEEWQPLFSDWMAIKQNNSKGNMVFFTAPYPASLFLNGKLVGEVPLLMTDIQPGWYRLRAEYSHYQAWEGPLLVTKDPSLVEYQIRLLPESVNEEKGLTIKKKQEDYQRRLGTTYQPYRGWNLFRNGNDWEFASKYSLAISVISFASAIITRGIEKRKLDNVTGEDSLTLANYQTATNILIGTGITSLLASGTLLYLSAYWDDRSFAMRRTENQYWVSSPGQVRWQDTFSGSTAEQRILGKFSYKSNENLMIYMGIMRLF